MPQWVLELTLSDWLLAGFLLGMIVWLFDYGVWSPWWKHPIGYIVLTFTGSILLLMVLIVYGVVMGERIVEWMRSIAGFLLCVGVAGMILILHVSRYEGKIERRERREREHKHARATLHPEEGKIMTDASHDQNYVAPSGGGVGQPPPALPAQLDAVAVVSSAPIVIANKYQAAILGAAVTLIFALQTSMTGGWSDIEAWNFAALALGTIISYAVPLLASKHAAALKIFGAVIGAVLVGVIAFVYGANDVPTWNSETITAVVFAGIQALATAMGVHRRVDEAKAALVDPAIDNAAVQSADAGAVKAAAYQLAA